MVMNGSLSSMDIAVVLLSTILDYFQGYSIISHLIFVKIFKFIHRNAS